MVLDLRESFGPLAGKDNLGTGGHLLEEQYSRQGLQTPVSRGKPEGAISEASATNTERRPK